MMNKILFPLLASGLAVGLLTTNLAGQSSLGLNAGGFVSGVGELRLEQAISPKLSAFVLGALVNSEQSGIDFTGFGFGGGLRYFPLGSETAEGPYLQGDLTAFRLDFKDIRAVDFSYAVSLLTVRGGYRYWLGANLWIEGGAGFRSGVREEVPTSSRGVNALWGRQGRATIDVGLGIAIRGR